MRGLLRLAEREASALRKQLREEQKARDVLLVGDQRRMQVALDEMSSLLEVAVKERKVSDQLRTYTVRVLREQEAEVAALKQRTASAEARHWMLQKERAKEARKAATQARALQLRTDEVERRSAAAEAVEARVERRHGKAQETAQLNAKKAKVAASAKVKEADERVVAAEHAVDTAQRDADAAIEEAEEEAQLAREARDEAHEATTDALHEVGVMRRREQRAKTTAEALRKKLEKVAPPTRDRTPEERAALSRDAARQVAHRERLYLRSIFTAHEYSMDDLAVVLNELKLLTALFDTKSGFSIHFDKVEKLMVDVEKREFGNEFGLYLHYELHLTLAKILQLTQASCKSYHRVSDRYLPKVMLAHPWRADKAVNVPRLAPPRSKLEPLMKLIQEKLGVEAGEDGRLAFRDFGTVLQELCLQDPGIAGAMPPLPYFMGGVMELPIVIVFDATGFKSQQLNTIAVKNPYASQSANVLRIFGLGNCSDDHDGTSRLLGPNRDKLRALAQRRRTRKTAAAETTCVACEGVEQEVPVRMLVSTDVAALRHCEMMACSGWCMCSRDRALRQTPKKPASKQEVRAFLKQCVSPTFVQRCELGHRTVPGEDRPRPCLAAGCNFAHRPEQAADEQAAMYAEELVLSSDKTKAGKAAFSKWRMTHAHAHGEVQPGEHGASMLEHDLDDQILDQLHMGELGCPKTPWKHGVLNNASDDARDEISAKCKKWKHPIDTRRKEDNRIKAEKWFTGEKWGTFCAGERGSPGGPQAIAEIVYIIAADMQKRGVVFGSGFELEAETGGRGSGRGGRGTVGGGRGSGRSSRGRGRSNAIFLARAVVAPATGASAPKTMAGEAGLRHVPTALELACDLPDLQIIRDLFGSRGQTIINSLLSFDGYFNWYYPIKNDCPKFGLQPDEIQQDLRLDLMFKNTCSAIDMHEIFERISIRKHGSYLPHGAIFKVSRDIDLVGDPWACGTASLELQNAETKRVADSGGARRLTMSDTGVSRKPMRGTHEGPARLVETKGYSGTMVTSTLNKLLAVSYLRSRTAAAPPPHRRRAAPALARLTAPAPAPAPACTAPASLMWQAWRWHHHHTRRAQEGTHVWRGEFGPHQPLRSRLEDRATRRFERFEPHCSER